MEGDFSAPAGGRAIDHRDYGLRDGGHLPGSGLVRVGTRAAARRDIARLAKASPALFIADKLGARAEGSPRAGEDHHAH